jgi:hypothetical protein
MRFSAFSSFLQKVAFQRSKSQLKSLSFVFAFGFSAFRLEKPAEKQKQTGPKGVMSGKVMGLGTHRGGEIEDMQRCSSGCVRFRWLTAVMAPPEAQEQGGVERMTTGRRKNKRGRSSPQRRGGSDGSPTARVEKTGSGNGGGSGDVLERG